MKSMKVLMSAAGLAAIAAATPATAQYYNYGYTNPYVYGQNAYNRNVYGQYANATAIATQQCTAAVQNRLYTRTGLSGVVASLFGMAGTTPRITQITRVTPNRSYTQVRGLASTGRSYGMYGAAYAYAPDLNFKCDVDYRGRVRDVDITRRY
jgi:hypothetical protein